MELMDESAGEILVVRDAFRSCVAVHVRGLSPEDYRIVQLTRQEARRFAALLLYQAERLGDLRIRPAGGPGESELNCA